LNRIGLIVVVAAFAGCAPLSLERGAEGVIAAFELNGRVAVRHGNEAASGRIIWRHGPSTDDLLITSPVGQGLAKITRRGGQFILVTADQKEYRAGDAESLTENVLGWRLPLAGLPDWIQGRAYAAGTAEVVHDQRSRLSELRQDDWRIEYQEYEGERPSKLRLTRQGLEIRLVVDEWLVPR